MSSNKKSKDSKAKGQGLNSNISRRDFVGGTLLGAGAGLLAMSAPTSAMSSGPAVPGAPKIKGWPPIGMGPEWTGPGGLGDYAQSNGNTHRVVNSAHAIAQKVYTPLPDSAIDTGEVYDVVSVGGGFAGLSTGFTTKLEAPDKKVLIIDNHPIFGGEGKMNIMEVDGQKLYAPQGSNDFCVPDELARAVNFYHDYWDKLGIPSEYEFVETHPKIDGKIKIARDNFGPQVHQIHHSSIAHFYFDEDQKGGTWVNDPWGTYFEGAPIPQEEKDELMRFITEARIPEQAPKENWEAWLDSMTYKEYIEDILGYSPKVTAFMDYVVASGASGVSCASVSALMCYSYAWPGSFGFFGEDGYETIQKLRFGTFPGGNAGISRYFVKNMFPGSIEGESLEEVHTNPLNWDALDRPENNIRMRLGATGVHVQHDGDPETAKTVTVAYEQGGKVYTVKARSVVMSGGGWANKHICKDLPAPIHKAYDEWFGHGPMLTVNVALRNWKFLEKLGASSVRWFGGEMGFWVNIRQPMVMGESTMPLDPDKPIVLSNYVAFPSPGQNLGAKMEGVVARTKLFSMSYADIEAWVVRHYTTMFAEFGFDAERDIAGIITNRWGHAYVSTAPGFTYDRDGKKSPMNTVREGYGRVFFGHSETAGRQLWNVGVEQGRRATLQALAKL